MLLASDVSPYLAVFGRFHLVLLHLPIGLLPGMLLLEFGSAIFRRPLPRGAILALAVMTAMVAGGALASGLVLAGEKVDSELLGQHKVAGIVMTVICGVLPLLALRSSRTAFRLVLLLGIASSVVTGHLGGNLTHKRGFLLKPLERLEQKAKPGVPAGGQQPDGGQLPDAGQGEAKPEQGAPTSTDSNSDRLVSYKAEVAPIFARVCTSCHNPDDLDGDFDLTTRAGILQLDLAEDERSIVPGKPDQSWLIEACELPVDDEDRMPPADEEQITKKEIAVLRRWIANGCRFD